MNNPFVSVAMVIYLAACSSGTDYDVAEDSPSGNGGSQTTVNSSRYAGGAPTSSSRTAWTSPAETGGAPTSSGFSQDPASSRGGAPPTITSSSSTTRPGATGGVAALVYTAGGAAAARGGAAFIGSGGATFSAPTFIGSGGSSAITIPWVTTYGGVASTMPNSLAGVGGLQWAGTTTYTTSTSMITLLPSQNDAPCMLDSHCEPGSVCKMQGTSPELAALGIGHCVASSAKVNGAGGAYLN